MSENGFRSESELAKDVRLLIRQVGKELWPSGLRMKGEVRGRGGVADIVLFRRDGLQVRYVVALELKLTRWQRALQQAFHYRNFANESYVVLDDTAVAPALRNIQEFRSANVGLISVDKTGQVIVHHLPAPDIPFSTASAKAIARELLHPNKTLPAEGLTFLRTIRGGAALFGLREELLSMQAAE